jgi:hypothetical protein
MERYFSEGSAVSKINDFRSDSIEMIGAYSSRTGRELG